MKHLLKQLFGKFDALSLRERAFVLIGVAVLIYGAMDRTMLAPQLSKKKQMTAELTRLRNSNNELTAKVAAVPKPGQVDDPDAPLREKIQDLAKELADIEHRLEASSVNLIPPGDMSIVLEEFVGKQSDLRLIGLRSLDAEPLIGESDDKKVARLFQHGVSIEVVGSYDAIYRYLKAIESSPWRIYWESIDIKSEKYPEITATLGVYTLNLSDNWLSL
ncbi:MAG: hypothetical protein EPN21_12080 [Methylococcaceae bacterium]|nr:MAG: hypothetical protein EPN21_12080 [Methylococcaceae bacterium]